MPSTPVDPRDQRYALEGKVVTMDDRFTVYERGVVYIEAGQIVAVAPLEDPPPAGLEDVPLIRTGGTIYPGLIELHNHLSYNVLPLWVVPKRFDNRAQWSGHPIKRKIITGPMQVLGKTPHYVPSIARYVEAKCLLSGVTTSQGLSLYGVGIQPYYRGLVRNVEDTEDPALPEARTKISDVEASEAEAFLERLEESSCLLLHLGEGADLESRRHFEALQLGDDEWAITPALAGIHCVALNARDFQLLARHGGSMVWSPLSNLILYGRTADVRAAKGAGVLMALGSDWSPSGSKNLLCEMKVAHLLSESLDGLFSPREIVAMATRNAARIVNWDGAVGSLETGKRADLVVVNGRQGDPYAHLIGARESSITLVMVDGVARAGQSRLMAPFGAGTENWVVGEARRVLNLDDDTADPLVRGLSLAEARDRLSEGLRNLVELARPLDEGTAPLAVLARLGHTFDDADEALAALASMGAVSEDEATAAAGGAGPLREGELLAFLELEQDELLGQSLRPHLPDPVTGELTGFPSPVQARVSYADLLKDVRVDLDPLTIVDDEAYFQRLAAQPNLPDFVKAGLPPLYGVNALPDDSDFVERLHPAVQSQFRGALDLATFLHTGGLLSLDDRRRLAGQALALLDLIYVHLPLKKAMHAIDPIQRLRLLQYQLEQQTEAETGPELDFHNEMTEIFTSARDLHTNYLLPQPFRDKTAFLPFLIEEYFENGRPHYIVSKVVGQAGPSTFRPGVEVLYWNGVPIERAIQLNAQRQAGGNPDARHSRALDSLTIRPLVRMLPPDEEWVALRYRTLEGEEEEMRQSWLVFSPAAGLGGIDPRELRAEVAVVGLDLQTDAIQQVKKVLFAPAAVEAEQRLASATAALAAPPQAMGTTMPGVFRARRLETAHGTFGYIRIFTFNVSDADPFVQEFVRLASQLPEEGLIVDVRGNGGGLIYAAERLLQVLTPRTIEPERAQFINTPLTLELCRRHAPSPTLPGFDLGPWIESIAQAVQTGATYSRAFPITSPASANALGQFYSGPVLLITDALCYSATDIFAAGFQDHEIGPILGTSGNTGAGGANVWTHGLLQALLNDPARPFVPRPDSAFQPLPHDADMRVAVRRTLRVRDRTGVPLEDLGVEPDACHQTTRRDLMEGNADLLDVAGRMLAELPFYRLVVQVERVEGTTLETSVRTKNLSRLDMYLEARPQGSVDVADGVQRFVLDVPGVPEGGDTLRLEFKGYVGGELVAARRIAVKRTA